MFFLTIFMTLMKRLKEDRCSLAFSVDRFGPLAYIGGGPRSPNGVLSFWKE
jgi:hypothetical protein